MRQHAPHHFQEPASDAAERAVQRNVNVGYDLSYTYGTDAGKKFQLQTVGDVNYRTEETPGEDANVKNSHAYEYDANGNLIYVNTSREKKDGENDEKAGERKLRWDEEAVDFFFYTMKFILYGEKVHIAFLSVAASSRLPSPC